ncbi:thioredoxin family protein [Psychromonas sp. MB-3u-54]|uniref:glutaredoxin family protein n=1 Tax=Psychromonas sp. MB-3u-54 TaxID=2058319 RepID=UPI000C343117|nr:glutaredoxin family protein [Psychromonas sp. MB-3u-54]PKH01503.1 thioredoxin family protein [Psychromonas sp. MB-3u-54]
MAHKHFLLYFTDGCHLCDDAQRLLQQTSVSYSKVDIIDDPQLVSLYGYSIPVIESDNGNTLNWPFDLQQLNDFINLHI